MLDDSIANASRQKIDNRGVNFGRRGKRPAFLSAAVDHFGNLIGQLFIDPSIGFVSEFALGGGCRATMRARSFGNRKAPGEIGDFVEQSAVRIGDIERLD